MSYVIPEKIAVYSYDVLKIMTDGQEYNPAALKNYARPEGQKVPEHLDLPDNEKLSGDLKKYIREVAIDGEAEKIFQTRLKEWGRPYKAQIVLDWVMHHIDFPTEKQIMGKTKELYLGKTSQEERDVAEKADHALAGYKVNSRLVFDVALPVNLIPARFHPMAERKPLYAPEQAEQQPAEPATLQPQPQRLKLVA